MTIQLLHTFNGYAPGIYSSMGSTEEARLVGLGLARYYTAGMDGDNPVFSNSEQRSIRGVVSDAGMFALLPRWKAALAAMVAGTRNAKMLVLADSTGAGAFANAGAAYGNNNMASSWPYALAQYFQAEGYRTNLGSVFGDETNSASPATLSAHDTRRNVSANWTLVSFASVGGQALQTTAAGSTNKNSFTPAETFDTIKVIFPGNSVYGKFAIAIDGGAALTNLSIDGGAATSIEVNQASYPNGTVHVVTATVPRGTHTVDIFRAASDAGTGATPIMGVWTTDSTQRAIDIINASTGGSTTAVQSTNSAAYMPLAVVANQIVPDLTIICLDINDWIGAVAAGTYDLTTAATHSEQLRKIIVACQVSGDVILMTGAPSKISSYTRAAQDAILQATRNLSRICNVPIVDVSAGWGGYVAGLAAGLYAPNSDVVHPGAAGYADIAARVAAVLGVVR